MIYNSKTGTTKKYAEEISRYLKTMGVETQTSSIQRFRDEILDQADYVLLGSWTNGLMFFFQHPDKDWKDFAVKLPSMPDSKFGLFTTYKILTGSMFKNMYKELKSLIAPPLLELKSRDGSLSKHDKEALNLFIN